jgi:hypothetical protein
LGASEFLILTAFLSFEMKLSILNEDGAEVCKKSTLHEDGAEVC